MVNEGCPWPSPDKMMELRRLVVNSGSPRFVRFQISIYYHHLLFAWVHRDMVWVEFLEEVVKECGKPGWFENDRRTLSKRMMAATVTHGKFDPNSSCDYFIPTDRELKLVETSSSESSVGSVLTHVITTIKITYPNILDIRFVRRSQRACRPPSTPSTYPNRALSMSVMSPF